MFPEYINREKLEKFIQDALTEDVGTGDHTSLASIPNGVKGKAKLIFKDEGIAAGIELADIIFKQIDPALSTEFFIKDGQHVKRGDIGFIVSGPTHSILKAERLVLNCMQRMSGIATLTHHFTQLLRHTKTKVLDTRKTTPNFRMLEKWAVKIGGGVNHRFGLYDMILLKDNHIDYAGGVEKAILSTVDYLKNNNLNLKISIEARSLKEVREVIETGHVHRILLDNMLTSTLSEAVRLIDKRFETEASGGVNASNIKEIADTGVDFISVGQLTHSYKSLDISLKAINE